MKDASRLRILLTADAVGGVWQYTIDLARGLSSLGFETIIAVLGPSPSQAQLKHASAIAGATLIDTGLALDWMASNAAEVRETGEAIARVAVRRHVDIVQLHAPALAAEVSFPVPVVAVNHSCITTWWSAVNGGKPSAPFDWRGDLTGRGLKVSDVVVTPTAAFAEATRAAYGLERLPRAVHNGRSPLSLPPVASHDFAFTAGRLWDKGKNIATLDKAAAHLAVPLYAAGPVQGPNGDTVELAQARSLGNLGELELARWLAARPVFVSAALYEPFGLAVLEAAAAGCPLVLSDIPTFRELWDGVAIFVEAKDDEGFAKAVGDILGDALLRTHLGDAAKERAALYTPQAVATQMSAIYAELATNPANAGNGGAQAAA